MSNDPIQEIAKNMAAIQTDESQMEFLVPSLNGESISVPYSSLTTHKEQRDAVIRLVRKHASHDVILAFIEKARSQHKWSD